MWRQIRKTGLSFFAASLFSLMLQAPGIAIEETVNSNDSTVTLASQLQEAQRLDSEARYSEAIAVVEKIIPSLRSSQQRAILSAYVSSLYIKSGRKQPSVESPVGGGAPLPPAPDATLKRYCLTVGTDGILSSYGVVGTTPIDVDNIVRSIEQFHKQPGLPGRNIVIYAHGGLTPESAAIENAARHVKWWEANGIYPIYFIWQTALSDYLHDTYDISLPSSPSPSIPSPPKDPSALDQAIAKLPMDGCIELLAHHLCAAPWNFMKKKALDSSAEISSVDWHVPQCVSQDFPASSLFISRLKDYAQRYPDLKIHLVGHSAGSIFCAGMLEALERNGLHATSVSFLAPALTVGDFQRLVLRHLPSINKFTIFNLSDKTERQDRCALNKDLVYHSSLLYLVSKSIERSNASDSADTPGMVPILGLSRFENSPMSRASGSLASELKRYKGRLFKAPNASPLDGQTTAKGHSGYADDSPTMDSIARIITGRSDVAHYDKNSWRDKLYSAH